MQLFKVPSPNNPTCSYLGAAVTLELLAAHDPPSSTLFAINLQPLVSPFVATFKVEKIPSNMIPKLL
jgi:hypothetical protein